MSGRFDGPHGFTYECERCRELLGVPADYAGVEHRFGYTIVRLAKSGRAGMARWLRLARDRAQGGQALVEFALVTPILLSMLLGFGEAAALVAQRDAWARLADDVAGYVAHHPADDAQALWDRVREPERCAQGTLVLDWPDGDEWASGAILRAVVTCPYSPRIAPGLFDGLPVSAAATAVVP